MVIEDSGADSSWLFGKILMTQNLMPFRKITVGSLRLLMLRDLETFIPVTATRLRQESCQTDLLSIWLAHFV